MISTNTELLRDAIARARLVAGRNSAMPMYSTVMIHAAPENAWMTITAAAVECMIALDVEGDVDAPLSVCVDADRFALAVNVPGEKTKLSLEGERLKIATGKSVFRLPHQPADNFPLLLSDGKKVTSFESEWLAKSLRMVLPFTGSSDHARMEARGVSLKGGGGKLKIEGTTGAVAASLVRDLASDNFSVMLPARSCEILAEIEPTKAILKDGTAVFLREDVQFTTVFLQAHLSDVEGVFPKPDAMTFKMPRAAFVEAVKSVSALSDAILKRSRPVRLEVDGLGTMVVSALSQNGEGRAEVECSGPAWEGSYDAGYLLALADTWIGADLELRFAPAPNRLGTTGEEGLRAVTTEVRI